MINRLIITIRGLCLGDKVILAGNLVILAAAAILTLCMLFKKRGDEE